jgi:hypothetical protein
MAVMTALCQRQTFCHCSNNGGLLGQVLPKFRQQFSFDTYFYFFPPASGKIHSENDRNSSDRG